MSAVQALSMPMAPGLAVAGPAPCNAACPAGVNAQAYVSLMAQGRFQEALEVVRERLPFVGVCGRVCTAPCEQACLRADADGALAIRALKRFLGDLEPPRPYAVPRDVRPERIAVVGSGPAGLTCALDLRRLGYPVTVYEAGGEPGGMLANCIPAYRLPRAVVRAEVEAILASGVELRTGVRVGRDVDLQELLASGFAAAFVAVGAQAPAPLGIPGEDQAAGLMDALVFLRDVAAGDRRPPGRRVVVVGGGSSAMDAARTALRLGADEVRVVYRRRRADMPAAGDEVAAALEEGVILQTLLLPTRLVTREGRVEGIECVRTRPGDPDRSGRPRPIPVPGTEHVVPCDLVVAAVGQAVETDVVAGLPGLASNGRLATHAETLQAADVRIFAGGDAVLGPATVVEAVGHGHRAAAAIDRFLRTGGAAAERRRAAEEVLFELPLPPGDRRSRLGPPHLPVDDRLGSFAEVEAAFTAEWAMAEAARCLRCGSCAECRLCVPTCPRRLVAVPAPTAEPGFALARAPSGLAFQAGGVPGPEPLVPAVIAALCRACGQCVDVCAYGALALGRRADGSPGPVAITEALCRACGTCVGECPTEALAAGPLEGDRLRRAVRELCGRVRAETGAPPLLVLRCQWPEADPAELPPGPLATLRLPCAGRVDAGLVLEALIGGARGVLVSTCPSGRCKYGSGQAAHPRLRAVADLVRRAGAGPDALRLVAGAEVWP